MVVILLAACGSVAYSYFASNKAGEELKEKTMAGERIELNEYAAYSEFTLAKDQLIVDTYDTKWKELHDQNKSGEEASAAQRAWIGFKVVHFSSKPGNVTPTLKLYLHNIFTSAYCY